MIDSLRKALPGDIGMPEATSTRFPIICMLKHEFDALPEYSATMPTGTTPGKRWRRRDGAHDPRA